MRKGYEILGYASYAEYLKSPLWSRIRREVLWRDGSECRICRAGTRIVHHQSYDVDTLLGKRNDRLVALCDNCHHKAHFDKKGNKRSWQQMQCYVDDQLRKIEMATKAKAKKAEARKQQPKAVKQRHKCRACKRIKCKKPDSLCPRCTLVQTNVRKAKKPHKRLEVTPMQDAKRKAIMAELLSKPRF